MTSIAFDTLGYFERLKAAGMPEAQAKVQVEVMQSVVQNYDEVARKELATKADIQQFRTEINERIAESKHEILKWVMGMLVAQTALILSVFAFIK